MTKIPGVTRSLDAVHLKEAQDRIRRLELVLLVVMQVAGIKGTVQELLDKINKEERPNDQQL